jgi:hypothetical protein
MELNYNKYWRREDIRNIWYKQYKVFTEIEKYIKRE